MGCTRRFQVVAALALMLCCVRSAAAQAPAAEWAPGSSDLLFTSNREGNGEIYLLPAGATEWINLTKNPAADNWPVWSPDGLRIVFQSRRAGNLDIWVMNADGSDPKQLTNDPEADYLPAWSPDGSKITFSSWRREAQDAERANHVYIMNADGSEQRRLFAESPRTSAGVEWSPDGSFLLLSRAVGEDGADIFLLRLDGTVLRKLTEDGDKVYNGSATVSPDGSRVAFYADGGDGAQLVVVKVDGTERRVVAAEGKNWYPRWSPDGKWLVYTAAVPGSEEKNLEVLAIPVDSPAPPVTLAGGPAREQEGIWRPRR